MPRGVTRSSNLNTSPCCWVNRVFIPTVKVARPELPGGYVVINEADFDPATMTLFDENAPPVPEKKPVKKAVKNA